MAYEAFLECLLQNLQAALGEEFHFILRPLPRNNGVTLDGLTLQGPGAHLAPTIYLNPYYQKLIRGSSLESIVEEILQLYQTTPPPASLTAESVINFEYLKDKIMFRMIHNASNQVLLSDVPHIPYLDLSIIFFLSLERTETGQVTAMIHNSHLRIWNISLEDLKTSALANSPRLFPPVISSMACIIEEMNRGLNPHFQETRPKPETPAPFYVLSNRSGINGAACILYEDVLKNFADGVEKNLIILPSSIHEVLLLPDDGDISYAEMSRLVTHINRSEVPEEDRLSNQVYLYSRETGEVTMASSGPASIC